MSARVRRQILIAILLALSVGTSQAGVVPQLGNFVTHGHGTAGWVNGIGDPSDPDRQSIMLTVPDSLSYAGFDYQNEASTPPSAPPSFSFMPTSSGAGAGSPRFVVAFSDSDDIYAAPAEWSAGSWTTVGGALADWHDAGLDTSCPAADDVTYSEAVACHLRTGEQVTDVYLIDDTPTPGAPVYVDDIAYGSFTIRANSSVSYAGALQTGLPHKVRVNVHTGRGIVAVACALSSGTCNYAATLTTSVHGRPRAVGVVSGHVSASAQIGTVTFDLNALGRTLLASAKSIRVIATAGSLGQGTRRFTVLITT